MSSSQPLPSTPRKRDTKVDDVIEKLNADYSLGLQLPDPTISPRRCKELARENAEYARWSKINTYICRLSFKDHGLLQKVIHNFQLEVEAESQNWLPRFKMGEGTPTAGQRLKMQNMLLEVCERAMEAANLPLPRPMEASSQALPRPSSRMNASFPQPTFSRTTYSRPSVSPSRERSERQFPKREDDYDEDNYITGGRHSSFRPPALTQPAFPSQKPRTKRPSLEAEEDEEDSSPKRRKGGMDPSGRPASSMVDVIPSRRRFGDTGSPVPELPHAESTGTSNNSSLSISRSCFDSTEEFLDTQTTVGPESPKQKRPDKTATNGTKASPGKKDPYPSSQTVILPSINRRRPPAGTMEDPIPLEEIPERAPRIQRHYPSSPTLTGTVYSSVPEIEDCDHLWDMRAEPRAPDPASLEARLQDIWREYLTP